MNIQDPISDMIVNIKNGQLSNKKFIFTYYSKLKFNILNILKNEGFIKKIFFLKFKNNVNKIKIFLKYYKNKPVIENINIISKPSLRIYIKKNFVNRFKFNFGVYIISTSKGVFTDKDIKKIGIGGELLCYVN
ncbi:30S ribosomal protein S8 [Candidatus Nardonella dryophthoridicola]|uniref:Small ribosomal subunit protein uS8 n=1 Tax=endosymbiont of Rhynchophorus ferrugineus TaxID=1972133 RepID=A0A2Z5T7V9_9GAMM|nr:30S ribosomal protein S8 [Candidatus Nardonella dryophthoridicola]QTJ62859.1 30S ribosomal protein S8 [Candidatus Nardonella dryophthoridicola]BBA85105.1 30S ribosomal protein S8 [endosymbiont of Rhynchophorus ferrugineus]